MGMGRPSHSFYLLINAETRKALPNDQQPLSDKMTEVMKFVSKIRQQGVGIMIAVVFPGSWWEKVCKSFPRDYPIETLQQRMAKVQKGISPKGR